MKKQEKKSVSLAAKVMAGALAGILILGVVFTLVMSLGIK